MTNLVKKVQNTIFQQNLFSRGDKIILAVSGGPDSVCLLDIFHKLQKKYSLSLAISHVNYGLRGKDSDSDEKFVRTLAKKYALEIHILNPKTGKKDSSENNLRGIRYNFLEKIRSEIGYDRLAVAHNLDDQAETFLMRVIRGSGLQGLTAMKFRNDKIIRPLLDIRKREIIDYLEKNNLAFHIDKTNLESVFLRNKIRNQLLPFLEKNFNPKIKDTIAHSIKSISDDQAFLTALAHGAWQENKNLSVKKLVSLDEAILRRVLLLAISQKRGNLKDIEAANIDELMKALKSTKSKNQIVSFKGLKVVRKGDKLNIERA